MKPLALKTAYMEGGRDYMMTYAVISQLFDNLKKEVNSIDLKEVDAEIEEEYAKPLPPNEFHLISKEYKKEYARHMVRIANALDADLVNILMKKIIGG